MISLSCCFITDLCRCPLFRALYQKYITDRLSGIGDTLSALKMGADRVSVIVTGCPLHRKVCAGCKLLFVRGIGAFWGYQNGKKGDSLPHSPSLPPLRSFPHNPRPRLTTLLAVVGIYALSFFSELSSFSCCISRVIVL